MQPHAAVHDAADRKFQTGDIQTAGQTAHQPSGRFLFFAYAVHDPHGGAARQRHRPMRRAAKDDLQNAVQTASAIENISKFSRSVHTITLVLSCEKAALIILICTLERSCNGIKNVTICRII